MPDPTPMLPLLFAQAAPAADPQGGSGGLVTLLPYAALIGLWGYFLLIRPHQQQEKKRREMFAALKRNDKVLTASGIYGTVISVDAESDRIVLRVDDDRGVKMTFTRSAVARVLDASSEKEKAGELA